MLSNKELLLSAEAWGATCSNACGLLSVRVRQQNSETLGSCHVGLRGGCARVNWDMIGALAEAVGAAAVVVSLLYLGRQMRDGTAQAKAEAYSAVMGRSVDWMSDLARDPDASAVYLKGLGAGLAGLTEEERIRFILLVLGLTRLIEESFLHRYHGSFPSWGEPAIDASITDLMATKGFQDFWKVRRHQFSEAFQHYIDGIDLSAARAVHGQAGRGDALRADGVAS